VKLYVMRHGPAQDQSDSGLDGDRALTPSGRERVRSVAKLLVHLGEAPAAIVTSPLVRAVQTAEIVAVVTQLAPKGSVEVRREMSPSGDARDLVGALATEGRKRVLIVGHEPDLGDLVTTLAGRAAFRRAFDKAMVVGLHVSPLSEGESPRDGFTHRDLHTRLRFVLDPKALRLDPDHRQTA
jgi:phosphohistidine phosphatase